MAYTLEPNNISHITKELPKTSCVTVAVDEAASS